MNPQIHTPPLTRINKILIILLVGLFLLSSILKLSSDISLVTLLGLSPNMVGKGLILQFITYPFIEQSLMGVIFNSLIIWFIGADLELKWGPKFYLKYLALSVIGAGLIFFGLGAILGNSYQILYGASGLNYALLVAYALIYPDRPLNFMMIFPIKAMYFCLLLGGIQLYMGIFSAQGLSALGHLAAMIIGLTYLLWASSRAQKSKKSTKKRNKAGLYIVKEEQDKADPGNPRYWQ